MASQTGVKTIYLHIGTPKTGTTSIQGAGSNHYSTLVRHGLLYPKCLGFRPPSYLLMIADPDRYTVQACNVTKLPYDGNYKALCRQFMTDLHQELLETDCSKVLLSSERLSARLFDPDLLASFRRRLHSFADDVKVIIYLRPQHELCMSWYSTSVKNCGTRKFTPPRKADDKFYNYDKLLTPWADVYGEENIIVRAYQTSNLLNGDIVRDVFGIMDLDLPELGIERSAVRNPSLDADTLEFLRQLNVYLPNNTIDLGKPDSERGNLVQALEAISTGPKLRLPPDVAQQIIDLYAESNARVARRFLGREDGCLFTATPDPFVKPVAARPDRMFEIMAHL